MNKVALVTGAAGGVGRAVVAQLSSLGWDLIVSSRQAGNLTAAFGDQYVQVVADCSTASGARQVLQAAREHGKLPVALVHCVGNIRLGAMHRMSEADFNDCLSANLLSAFHTLSAFVGALREANLPGAAVLISSAAARIGTPNHEAVAAAKAGLEGLVRAAAATYAANGIRVNAVAPGIMETPASARIIATQAAREGAARQYPLPGIGSPKELAELLAWLVSDSAARVTGQVWSLDGGFSSIRPLVK